MLKTETTKNVAAFIAEPILGVGGCIPAPKEYFKIVKEILLTENILLVVDEVQSGNGRTGKFFGIENYGIEPDVITIAKGLGGGLLPIGAVISKSEIADKHLGPDFSTFGGNPLSCLAALASLKVIKEEDLAGNAARVGDYMIKRLEEIERESKIVDGVEGMGLMIGMEIVVDKEKRTPATNDTLTRIMNEMAADGVLIGRGGLYYNRIRMEPPLCITRDEADRVLNVFEEVVKKNQN